MCCCGERIKLVGARLCSYMKNVEGGYGLNIPGRVMDGDYGCKAIDGVNTLMGG